MLNSSEAVDLPAAFLDDLPLALAVFSRLNSPADQPPSYKIEYLNKRALAMSLLNGDWRTGLRLAANGPEEAELVEIMELAKRSGQRRTAILSLGRKREDGLEITVVPTPRGVSAWWRQPDRSGAGTAGAEAPPLDSLVKNSFDGLVVLDLDGRVIFANPAAETMLGKETGRVMGYRLGVPAIDGESVEIHVVRRESEIVDLEMRAEETEWLGQPAFVVNLRDVTEQRRAEQELRRNEELLSTAGEMAKVGGWDLDPATNRVHWSRVTKSLHGVDEDFETDLETAVGFYASEAQPIIARAVAEALEKGTDYDLELPYVTADGQPRWARTIGRPHFKDGVCVRLNGTFQDITEMKLMEQERANAKEQFLQAQKLESIGQLAGGVAHDFNNMLGVILGFGEELMEEIHPSDPLHGSVASIMDAANRSASLTRQLLAFSRRQALSPKVLCLNEPIENLEKMLRRLIGEDIELVIDLQEEVGLIKVDPGQLEQVIMNLTVNARDAMPRGGKLVIETSQVYLDEDYIKTHPDVGVGEYVLLTISDTGLGMEEGTRRRIFEPFFSTKPKGKGTGLGLSTVYGIIRQSGGSIWVYSEVGKGSTFKIYLPVTAEESPSNGLGAESPGRKGRGELVLVVEDESSLRDLCRAMLKKSNYRVSTAANGGEALLMVEEEGLRPDLILTDVVMPGMSGKVMVERLQRVILELRVLYMSGYTDNAIVHHGVLDKGTPFIEKPFSRTTLGQRIRQVLDG